METLLAKPLVVALAVLGAGLATAASALRIRGKLSAQRAERLNLAGYAVMGLSMLLFALTGLLGHA
ncbi:MAG: hypothetical protein AB1773_16160 [Pseudomonadota bacterium]